MNSKIYKIQEVIKRLKDGNDIYIVENERICDFTNFLNLRDKEINAFSTTIIGGVDRTDIKLKDLKIFENCKLVLFGRKEKFSNLERLLNCINANITCIDPLSLRINVESEVI